MANTVFTTEEIELRDGTEIILRPLNIATLRVFMKYIDEFGKSETEEEGLEALLAAAALCLSDLKPEYYDDKKKRSVTRKGEGAKNEVIPLTTGSYTPEFEKVADMPTVYKVLDVCGGVRLNDPNLLAAAAQAVVDQDGRI